MTAPQPACQNTETDEYAHRDDWIGIAAAAVVFVLAVIALVVFDPRGLTRDQYLGLIAAAVGASAAIIGVTKIVERFQPKSRFFETFERGMLLVGAIWTAAAAAAAALSENPEADAEAAEAVARAATSLFG